MQEKRGWVFVKKKNTNNTMRGRKILNCIEGSQEKRRRQVVQSSMKSINKKGDYL